VTEFSFMVKTIARPELLRRLLRSVRRFYPTVPVYVADDSQRPTVEIGREFTGVTYVPHKHDVGIGHCLNDLLDLHVDTPIVVLLDDDFEFTARTQVEKLTLPVQAGLFDIAGGAVWSCKGNSLQRFVGWFAWESPQVLRVRQAAKNTQPPFRCDVVMNFFAARTEALREVRWDEDLKLARHLDFFLRVAREKRRVGYVGCCTVDHTYPRTTVGYRQYRWGNGPGRDRMEFYQQWFLRKWGLMEVLGMGGWKRKPLPELDRIVEDTPCRI
jgi:hypothetical protein